MATFKEELVEALLANAGVSALIEADPRRLGPPDASQNVPRPRIIYSIATTPDEETEHFGGHGLLRTLVNFSSIADSITQAESVSLALEAMLTDFSGALTPDLNVQKVKRLRSEHVGYSDFALGQQWDTDFEFVHT